MPLSPPLPLTVLVCTPSPVQSSRLNAPGAPSPAELDPAHLKVAEVQVMRLEKELGTSHPEVRPAPFGSGVSVFHPPRAQLPWVLGVLLLLLLYHLQLSLSTAPSVAPQPLALQLASCLTPPHACF